MRKIRSAALGATLLALLAAACTSGGGGNATTIAGTLVLGGPPECPQRPFCAKGLTDTYGISFKEFKPLDVGGPITVEAVKGGDVDVGLLFTSDPAIAAADPPSGCNTGSRHSARRARFHCAIGGWLA